MEAIIALIAMVCIGFAFSMFLFSQQEKVVDCIRSDLSLQELLRVIAFVSIGHAACTFAVVFSTAKFFKWMLGI